MPRRLPYGLGHRVDAHDPRDYSALDLARSSNRPVPPKEESVSFRGHVVSVLNQERTSSCVSHAIAQAMRTSWSIQGEEPVLPSVLDGYYRGRYRAALQGRDEGSRPRDVWQAYREGFVEEEAWPFNAGMVQQPIPLRVLREAHRNIDALTYYRVPEDPARVALIRWALWNLKPVCLSVCVNDELFNYRGGVWNFLEADYSHGRHYVMLTGFNDGEGSFEAVNSWGSAWGERGFFRIGYATVRNIATVRDVIVLDTLTPAKR